MAAPNGGGRPIHTLPITCYLHVHIRTHFGPTSNRLVSFGLLSQQIRAVISSQTRAMNILLNWAVNVLQNWPVKTGVNTHGNTAVIFWWITAGYFVSFVGLNFDWLKTIFNDLFICIQHNTLSSLKILYICMFKCLYVILFGVGSHPTVPNTTQIGSFMTALLSSTDHTHTGPITYEPQVMFIYIHLSMYVFWHSRTVHMWAGFQATRAYFHFCFCAFGSNVFL